MVYHLGDKHLNYPHSLHPPPSTTLTHSTLLPQPPSLTPPSSLNHPHSLHPPPSTTLTHSNLHPSTHFAITLRLSVLSTALQSFLLCCRLRFFPFTPPPSTTSPPPTPPSLSDSKSAHFFGGRGSCKTSPKNKKDNFRITQLNKTCVSWESTMLHAPSLVPRPSPSFPSLAVW